MPYKKNLLLIVGAVMMLASAASAQVFYCEKWEFTWGSGTINYDGTLYEVCDGYGFMWCVQNGHNDDDNTGDGMDYFLEDDWWATFVSEDGEDSLKLTDASYDVHIFEGWKATGQSGVKEGSGYWCAYDSWHEDYLWGTWNTGGTGDQYYFYYPTPPATPICRLKWHCTGAVYGAIGTDVGESQGDASGNRLTNQNPCTEF